MSLNEYCFSINAIFDLFVFSFISIVKIKVKLQVIRTFRDKIQSRGEFFGNNVFLELFFKVGAKISEFRKIRPRTRFYLKADSLELCRSRVDSIECTRVPTHFC